VQDFEKRGMKDPLTSFHSEATAAAAKFKHSGKMFRGQSKPNHDLHCNSAWHTAVLYAWTRAT
jgi:hypothetical protein